MPNNSKKVKLPQFVYDEETGTIRCNRPVEICASVIWLTKGFHLKYDGERSKVVDSILRQMNSWFFYVHIKKEADGPAKY